MKGIVKAIIAGSVIIVLGLVILLVTLGLNGWEWTGSNLEWAKEEYVCANSDSIKKIELNFNAGELEIVFYDQAEIKVEYYFTEKFTTKFSTKDSTLKIATDRVKFITPSLWWGKIPKTTVYLPSDENRFSLDIEINAGTVTIAEAKLKNLDLTLNAGAFRLNGNTSAHNFDIEINAGVATLGEITCDRFTCDISAGTVNVKNLACSNVAIDVSAGSVNLRMAGAKEEYTIVRNVSAGSCNVAAQSGSTPAKIKIDVSAGSVSVTFAIS